MSEWQKIKTAPKDGSHILLWDSVEKYTAEGYWEPDRESWYAANTHWTDAHDGELRDMTHWMPLPKGPDHG
jgi:hypothetical protein